jgi:hypothetical protein
MSNAIPTPDFQSSRSRRRSSIGQGAALSAAPGEGSTLNPEPPPAAAAPPAPAPATSERPAAEVPRPRPAATPGGRDAKKAAVAETPSKRLVGSKDILLSLPEDLKTRMVNTITWSHPYTGIGQQQKFIRKAITELCERLENDHNQGKPFPEPVVNDE